MRLPIAVCVLSVWASVVCACGSNPKVYHPVAPDAYYEVRVWIEDDPHMPKEPILAGCAKWSIEHVICIEAASLEEADIRVYSDEGTCIEKVTTDGNRLKLAEASPGGTIHMMLKCLEKTADGTLREGQSSLVITHEVGHELGIWEHVPTECSDDVPVVHPSGRKICGKAIMNPAYDASVTELTEIDMLAFDFRDINTSVLNGTVSRDESTVREYWIQVRP